MTKRISSRPVSKLLLGGALVLASVWTMPALARDAKAEAEIARIEKIFMNARSGQDMVPYLDPKSTFIWDVAPPEGNGVQGVKKHIDDILSHSSFKNFKLTLVKMQVMADGDVGFVNSLQHLQQFGPDGKIILDTHVRLTNTYRKTKGKWYCVGEHNSFPVDSTTRMAVFGPVPWPD